jgi:hypothetical protein
VELTICKYPSIPVLPLESHRCCCQCCSLPHCLLPLLLALLHLHSRSQPPSGWKESGARHCQVEQAEQAHAHEQRRLCCHRTSIDRSRGAPLARVALARSLTSHSGSLLACLLADSGPSPSEFVGARTDAVLCCAVPCLVISPWPDAISHAVLCCAVLCCSFCVRWLAGELTPSAALQRPIECARLRCLRQPSLAPLIRSKQPAGVRD